MAPTYQVPISQKLTEMQNQVTATPKSQNAPKSDYDTAGAQAAGLKPDARGHMPDTFKLPNHMTFSDESKYSKPGQEGGHWKYIDKDGKETDDKTPGGTWEFFASPFNLKQHSASELKQYFKTQEPNSKLFIPIGTKDGQPVYDLGNGQWQVGTK